MSTSGANLRVAVNFIVAGIGLLTVAAAPAHGDNTALIMGGTGNPGIF